MFMLYMPVLYDSLTVAKSKSERSMQHDNFLDRKWVCYFSAGLSGFNTSNDALLFAILSPHCGMITALNERALGTQHRCSCYIEIDYTKMKQIVIQRHPHVLETMLLRRTSTIKVTRYMKYRTFCCVHVLLISRRRWTELVYLLALTNHHPPGFLPKLEEKVQV